MSDNSKQHGCPHCGEKGISNWAKLTSTSFAPACCRYCRKYSYLHVFNSLTAVTFWIVVTWILIGIAVMTNRSFFLIASFPAGFLAIDRFMLQAPMRPVPDS